MDKPKDYWREEKIGGKMQRWNYRSEFVNRLKLDNNHTRIWASFGLLSILGFASFVYVKSKVILSRREQMAERERMRKLMQDADKKAGIIPG